MIRLTTVGVVLLVLLGASAAHASSYEVHGCRLPDGSAVSVDGWRGMQGESLGDPCGPPFGGFPRGFGGAGVTQDPNRAVSGVAFTAPPSTRLASMALSRFAVTKSGPGWSRNYLASTERGFSGPGEACFAPIGCEGLGDPAASADHEVNRTMLGGLDARRLTFTITCAADDSAGGHCPAAETYESTARFIVYRSQAILEDEAEPELRAAPSGSALDPSRPLEGEKSVSLSASDLGGGLFSAGLLIDGTDYATRSFAPQDADCRPPFTKVVPCPLNDDVTLIFDTAELPNGQHSVRTVVTDAAGNRTLSEPVTVTTRNGSQPNGRSASRFVRLSAWFAGGSATRSATQTVAYRRAATIRGELTNRDGKPVAGAVLGVSSRVARPGSALKPAGTVTTDPLGHFVYLAPPGPSRELRFGYRAFSLDPDEVTETTAALSVRAGVSLTASRRRVRAGRPVTFEGRLRGGPGQADAMVLLYALFPRAVRERIPVEALKTDRRGRFRFTYRFRTTPRATTYRFRAIVRRQTGYPYAPAGSRTVKVRVLRRR